MKKFLSISFGILFLLSASLFIACSKKTANYIDVSVYYDSVTCYNTNNSLENIEISNFTGNTDLMYRYNQIVFKNIPKWTSGLFFEYIEFDITSNQKATFDISFKISNLTPSENAEYNESYFWYVEKDTYLTLDENKPTHIKFEINQTINDGNGGFAIYIDKDSTLLTNENLYYKISNLKISAYHPE